MFNYFKKIIGSKELTKEEVGHYFYYGSYQLKENNDIHIIDSKKVETIIFLNTYATNSMKLIIESLKGKKEYHLEKRPEVKGSTIELNLVDFDSNYNKLIAVIDYDIAFFEVPDENEGFYFSREDLINEKYDSAQNFQKSQKEKDLILEKETLRKFQNLVTKIININPRCDILLQNEKLAVLFINSPKYNFTVKLSYEKDEWLHLEYSANNYTNSTHLKILSENILNFDKTDKVFDILEDIIISSNKLFSIDFNPLQKIEYNESIHLLATSYSYTDCRELKLTFEYGINAILRVDALDDTELNITPINALFTDYINDFIGDYWESLWSGIKSDKKQEKILNHKFELNPKFDKYSLAEAAIIKQENYKLQINIQGIKSHKNLNKLIHIITNTNKKIKIVERDELAEILLELYLLQYKFSLRLKLDLCTGILKVRYDVSGFGGELYPFRKLIDRKIKNEFDLVVLNDVNQAYNLLVKNILKINDLSNINQNPFENFDFKSSVRIINIYKVENRWIELLFEYGIKVRFRPKIDQQDFDDPWNPLDEIRYKYEVIPHNAMQFDVIDDLADHCVILMRDFDERELNRVLRVNDGWEFDLNPDFYNCN